jgi:hypothetical protein
MTSGTDVQRAAAATPGHWGRTPWVGWCVDSCRPGTRCLQELVPLL